MMAFIGAGRRILARIAPRSWARSSSSTVCILPPLAARGSQDLAEGSSASQLARSVPRYVDRLDNGVLASGKLAGEQFYSSIYGFGNGLRVFRCVGHAQPAKHVRI